MTNKFKFTLFLSIILIVTIIAVTISNKGVTLYNPNDNKTATIINEVQPYETEYVYNDTMAKSAEPVVLKAGVNGISYTYDGLNYIHISDAINEVIEVGTGKEGEYTGKLTGYGPDCPGCSSVGNVSCRTREGLNHSLINDGIYYNDITYGNVRIIAADNTAFPCGTVIRIDNGRMDDFYAIVLDSGSSMRNAWQSGEVWMDLAFSTQSEAGKSNATSLNTKFSVQRWGW